VEPTRESSWSGSEQHRKPQGICLPPEKPPNRTPRYLVRAGTPCLVTKITPLRHRSHITKIDLGFERHEGYKDQCYTFRHLGFIVAVSFTGKTVTDDACWSLKPRR
jgi:hypothetical protein